MPADAIGSRPRASLGFRVILLNAAVTVGLTLGITAVFGRQSLTGLLGQGKPWPVQVLWGAALGALFALPLNAAIRRVQWFAAFHRQMIDLVSRLDLSGLNPLWLSLCAGIGEELLFRGALQPLVGPWTTSVIFTAVHYQTGGFLTMNRWKAMYAVLIFVVSLGLGAECVHIGLIAAIVTHTVADVVSLTSLRAGSRDSSAAGAAGAGR